MFHQKILNYKTDNQSHTDAIVVLTGGRNRIAEALNLYNQGLADRLIISGVGREITLGELERQNKAVVRYLPDNVILGNEATNTIENAIEVSEAIRRNAVQSVRLVTSYYHMPRSEQEILAKNPDIKIIHHPVYSQYVSIRWWKKWGSFCLIASEYNKFMFVYMKNLVLKIGG